MAEAKTLDDEDTADKKFVTPDKRETQSPAPPPDVNPDLKEETTEAETSSPLSDEGISENKVPTERSYNLSSRLGSRRLLMQANIATGHSHASRIGNVYHKSKKGDIHLVPGELELGGEEPEQEEATWKDVFIACCCHSPKEWSGIGMGFGLLLLLLYFFLLGLELLSSSFQIVGGCTAGSLLGSDTNPVASLMIGIIATAVLQSSSTTVAIIVSLVSGGLDVTQGKQSVCSNFGDETY
jgi:hypothetical protein